MTNSLNTPVEALEYAYPFRMIRYSIRRDSGGAGKHHGGDGIVRELELLADAQMTLLADRRANQPWGLSGGATAAPGRATIIRNNTVEKLPGKCTRGLQAGTRIRIESPGGGGWGKE